jgi:hypothetical protein
LCFPNYFLVLTLAGSVGESLSFGHVLQFVIFTEIYEKIFKQAAMETEGEGEARGEGQGQADPAPAEPQAEERMDH